MQRENHSDAEAVYISSQEKLLDWLECVSKREIRKFEWIFRQFKE